MFVCKYLRIKIIFKQTFANCVYMVLASICGSNKITLPSKCRSWILFALIASNVMMMPMHFNNKWWCLTKALSFTHIQKHTRNCNIYIWNSYHRIPTTKWIKYIRFGLFPTISASFLIHFNCNLVYIGINDNQEAVRSVSSIELQDSSFQ